jgi:hypothetical protein
MNDERLGLDLGEWMKEVEFVPPDSRRSARQVATRLPRTSQLGRRWWLPSFQRSATTPPTTDQTTDLQPTPIPATNDHSPNVIGRTQSMFSPVKAVTAGALVFALGGVSLIAQPFDQQGSSVPGAETDANIAPPAEVTGRFVIPGIAANCPAGYTHENDGEVRRSRGERCHQTWTMSDDRLNGTVTLSRNEDAPQNGSGLVYGASAMVIENDGGTWRQRPVLWAQLPDFDRDRVSSRIFDGEGDYEGFIAVLMSDPFGNMQGYIIDGEFPPPPAFPATE